MCYLPAETGIVKMIINRHAIQKRKEMLKRLLPFIFLVSQPDSNTGTLIRNCFIPTPNLRVFAGLGVQVVNSRCGFLQRQNQRSAWNDSESAFFWPL